MSLPSATLFNDPRYHALHAPQGASSLVLAHHQDERLVGTLAGIAHEETFTSGYSAPFGGVDLVREDETPARICALVADAAAQLDARGLTDARVRCRPSCHGPAEDVVRFALLNAGFVVEEADLSFTLDLRGLADAQEWLAARKPPFRRALRHAQQDGLRFADADDWSATFAVLQANRAERGRELSIGLEQVLALREAFGERIRLAELSLDGSAVAAALTYRVSAASELVVAWGDSGHDLAHSPMPALVLALVERALADGLEALDLGTSTLTGPDGLRAPNDGLVQFKRAAGARAELRPVLRRTT